MKRSDPKGFAGCVSTAILAGESAWPSVTTIKEAFRVFLREKS
jgi:hypothetical protein